MWEIAAGREGPADAGPHYGLAPAQKALGDLASALEWYRRCKPAFTTTGIPTDEEIKEFLMEEAQALKLSENVPPARIFDFTLQRAVNKELAAKGR